MAAGRIRRSITAVVVTAAMCGVVGEVAAVTPAGAVGPRVIPPPPPTSCGGTPFVRGRVRPPSSSPQHHATPQNGENRLDVLSSCSPGGRGSRQSAGPDRDRPAG